MAIGNMDLHHALRDAGASDERASAAATSVAGYMPRFWFMFGTLAALTALVLGGLGMQWQLLDRIARFEARIDVRLESIENRLANVEDRLANVEDRLEGVESRLDRVETRLDGLDARFDAVEGRLSGIEARLPPP